MPRPLKDQVVVVTGASSGLGREAALQFAKEGARLVLAARDEAGLESLAKEIRAQGGRAVAVPTDVTRPEAVEHLAEEALTHFGRIDTWVNNAGVSVYGRFVDTPVAEMRQIFEVNLWGAIHGMRAAIPHMKEAGGVIINVGSVESETPVPLSSAYAATKHALRAVTSSVRMEFEHDQVPIDLVLVKPPSMDTPFFQHAGTRLGVEPKPIDPVYDPAVVAREIVKNATQPQREVMVGGAGQALGLLRKFAPTLFEKQLAAMGFSQQKSDKPKSAEAADNLYTGITEPGTVRGEYPGWKVSWVMWLEEHPKTAVAGLALGAGALAMLRRSRR